MYKIVQIREQYWISDDPAMLFEYIQAYMPNLILHSTAQCLKDAACSAAVPLVTCACCSRPWDKITSQSFGCAIEPKALEPSVSKFVIHSVLLLSNLKDRQLGSLNTCPLDHLDLLISYIVKSAFHDSQMSPLVSCRTRVVYVAGVNETDVNSMQPTLT